jgi:hypothetical protein
MVLYAPLLHKTQKNVFAMMKATTPSTSGPTYGYSMAGGSSVQLPNDIKSIWTAKTITMSYFTQLNSDTDVGIATSGLGLDGKAGYYAPGANQSLKMVDIYLKKVGTPTGNYQLYVSSGASPSDTAASSVINIDASTISTSYTAYRYTFSTPATTTGSEKLWVCLRAASSTSNASNYLAWAKNFTAINGTDSYSRNSGWVSSDSGAMKFTAYFESSVPTYDIHITTQETNGRVAYHKFNTSTDTWSIKNELATFPSAPAAEDAAVSHVVLSDGSVVVLYQNVGNVYYIKRSSTGSWGTATSVRTTGTAGVAVLGASDRTHFFYIDTSVDDLFHRSLTSDGTLNAEGTVDSAIGATATHFVGPGATTTGGTIAIPYSDADGKITVATFTSADLPTFTVTTGVSDTTNYELNATPITQTLVNGTDLYIIYVDNTTQDVFIDRNTGSGWSTDTNIQTATAQGISAVVTT